MAGLAPGLDGEVLNVVDDDLAIQPRVSAEYKRNVRRFRSLYLRTISYLLCWLWQSYSRRSQGQLPPAFNVKRWHANWKKTRYSNEKLKRLTGWAPAVATKDGLQYFFEACKGTWGMLRVGIIGCGKIADSHAQQIRRIPGCEIVGVADREPEARQLYERFPIRKTLTRVEQLLEESKPDVVHITTPPASHLPLAMQCLERGCHVYVEKPFTLNEPDARKVIAFANERGLKIRPGTTMSSLMFARRTRALVKSGYLGGPPLTWKVITATN